MYKLYLFSGKVTHAVKVSLTLAFSLLLIVFSEIVIGQESGNSPINVNKAAMVVTNVNVGVGQPYLSLTGVGGLFTAINTGLIAGDIVATIKSDILEPGLVSLMPPILFIGSLKIQSDGIMMRTLTGTATPIGLPLINIIGTKNVTIDGGAGKMLTIQNYTPIASITTGPVIQFSMGSLLCVVTNCNIQSNSLNNMVGAINIDLGTNSVTISNNNIRNVPLIAGSPFAGILSNSITNTLNITNNNIYNWSDFGVSLDIIGNGCTVSGNSFYMENTMVPVIPAPIQANGQIAISIIGGSGHSVTGNFIGGQATKCGGAAWINNTPVDMVGISMGNTLLPASIISGNTIQNIMLSGAGNLIGMQNDLANVIIRKNKIYNFGALASLGNVYGMMNNQTIGGASEYSNNMISVSGSSGAIYGFFDNSLGGTTDFYYNSINVSGTDMGGFPSCAFTRMGTSIFNFKNNIISNVRTAGVIGIAAHLAVSNTTNVGFNSDYNNFYVSGLLLGQVGLLNYANLAAWKLASITDVHSISVLPGFPGVNDLHILTNAAIANSGIAVPTVLDDIDGLTRSAIPGMGINQLFGALTATLTGVTADKVYDGSTAATFNISKFVLGGINPLDKVTLTGLTGTFADKNVGTGKIVTITGYTLGGIDAAKYRLGTTTITGVAITAKPLTITVNNISKAVGSLTTFTGTEFTSVGLVGNDVVTGVSLTSTGTPVTAAIGPFDIIASNAVCTALANYSITYLKGTLTVISALATPLTFTGVTADKVYDGTNSATFNITGLVMVGKTPGDNVTLTGLTGTFADNNVGTGKTVTITGHTFSGLDAGKYTLGTTTITCNITAKPLNISVNNRSKVFGTTTTFLGTEFTSAGLVGNDAVTGVTLTSIGSLATAANGIYDIIAGNAVGTGLSNYAISYTKGTLNVNNTLVTPLTFTGVTANKVYDGTNVAHFNTTGAVLTGINPGDNVTLTGLAGTFPDKNVGLGKTVTFTGYTLGGVDAGKYILSQSSITSDITSRVLDITATGTDKLYDATTTANVILSDNRIPNDNLSTTYTNALISDKKIGLNKPATVNGISISGPDAINYIYNTTTATTENIMNAGIALSISGLTANSKVYDGTNTATLNTTSAALSGVLLNDVVTLNTLGETASFTDMNVGTGKTVTSTGFAIEGQDMENYTVVNPTLTTTITPKTLDITPNTIAKSFGATTTFLGTEFTAAGMVNNETLTGITLTSPGTLATAAAGTYDIIASNAVGTRLSNYSINYLKGAMVVYPNVTQPADFTISTASVCKGTNAIAYSVPNIPSVTYNWSYSGTGVTINGTTNAVTLNFSPTATSGNLTVTASTPLATSVARSMAITVSDVPVVTIDPVLQVTLTSSATTGNQWYDANGIITGAINQTYTATRNGSYYVMVAGSCSTIKSNTTTVTHVSVPEFEKPTVNVYPNPSTGEFRVNYKASGNEKLKMIQVYNSLGKAVYQATPSSVTNDLTEWVSIKNQPVGIYILVLTTDNQRISRQIVIIK